MKLQKTLVAVAIAGIAAVPMVASADTTLAGVVEVNVNSTDEDGADFAVGTGDVLFGITSEHALNSGLTGYGSLRADLDRLSNEGSITIDPGTPGNDEDDTAIASLGSADSVFVGIKGGFGDFRLGEVPLAVEVGQVANDIFDVGGEISGGLSYSGSFGPVSIVANFSPEGNQEAVGIGAKFALGGFSIGVGAEDRRIGDIDGNGETGVNAAVGVGFAFAGASINAHFWTQEEDETAAVLNGDLESFSVKVDYGFAGVSAGLTFSVQEDDGATDDEAIRLDLGYALGGGTLLSTRITSETDNNNGDNDIVSYRVQLAKSF